MAYITSKIQSKSLVRFVCLCPTPLARNLCTSTATAETQSQRLERIADQLFNLNKLERFDYSILSRLKMGLNKYEPAVSGLDSQSAASSAGTGSGSADAKAAEKTVFDIKLEKFDAGAKIKIIKEVGSFTDLGLKEAKDLVDKAPVLVKKGVAKEENDSIIEMLKGLGASVIVNVLYSPEVASFNTNPVDLPIRTKSK